MLRHIPCGMGTFSGQTGVLSGRVGVLSDQIGVLSGRLGVPSDQVGVLSGKFGIDDLLDLGLLLSAPLLRTDSPRRSPPDRGHVGSRGLSIMIDGGRRPTTLLTNLLRPRSIFT
jgi:hypothetical protein